MDIEAIWTLLDADNAANVATLLRTVHLVGLAVGLGAAVLMEALILRTISGTKVSSEQVRLVHFVSRFVYAGIFLLWVSGIAMLAVLYQTDAARLASEVIWAKLIIVCVLSVNCILVHETVVPVLQHQVGRRLFEGFSAGEKTLVAVSFAISAVSWIAPLLIGAASETFASVNARSTLTIYAGALLMLIILSIPLVRAMAARPQHKRIQLRNYALVQTNKSSLVTVPAHRSRDGNGVLQRSQR